MLNLVQMCLAGSVLILAVLLVRKLAGRVLPRRGLLLLWEITALRLLVPFTLPSPVPARVTPRQPAGLSAGPVILPPAPPAVPQAVPAAPAPFSWEMLLALVWAVVSAGLAIWFGIAYLRLYRRFAQSLPEESPLVLQWQARHTLHRPVKVRMSDQIVSPLTYGVFRPVILLPKSMDRTDADALEGILTHEWTHIRCWDAVAKMAFAAVVCLYWWNPLIWVMYLLANRDMELACDAAVVQRIGRDKRTGYAMTLLNMAENQNACASLCANLTQDTLQERIVAIMKNKKTSKAAGFAAAVLVVCALAVFAIGKSGTRMVRPPDADWQPSVGALRLDGSPSENETISAQQLETLLADTRRSPFPEWKDTAYEENSESSAVSFSGMQSGTARSEQRMELCIYRTDDPQEWQGILYIRDVGSAQKERRYRLIDPEWVDGQLRMLGSPNADNGQQPGDAAQPVKALLDSIVCTEQAFQFTLPETMTRPEELMILVNGRLESEDGFGQSVHYLEQEKWEPGKTYTIPREKNCTDLTLYAAYLEEEAEVDLLDLARRSQLGVHETLDALIASIRQEGDQFVFTIPRNMTSPENFWLHISRQVQQPDGPSMELYFAGEKWEPGREYTVPGGDDCASLVMELSYCDIRYDIDMLILGSETQKLAAQNLFAEWIDRYYDVQNNILHGGIVDYKLSEDGGGRIAQAVQLWDGMGYPVMYPGYQSMQDLDAPLKRVATPRGWQALGVTLDAVHACYQEEGGRLYYRADAGEGKISPELWNNRQWNVTPDENVPLEYSENTIVMQLRSLSGGPAEKIRFVRQDGLWLFDGPAE